MQNKIVMLEKHQEENETNGYKTHRISYVQM